MNVPAVLLEDSEEFFAGHRGVVDGLTVVAGRGVVNEKSNTKIKKVWGW